MIVSKTKVFDSLSLEHISNQINDWSAENMIEITSVSISAVYSPIINDIRYVVIVSYNTRK